jgi:hypothetical protein
MTERARDLAVAERIGPRYLHCQCGCQPWV